MGLCEWSRNLLFKAWSRNVLFNHHPNLSLATFPFASAPELKPYWRLSDAEADEEPENVHEARCPDICFYRWPHDVCICARLAPFSVFMWLTVNHYRFRALHETTGAWDAAILENVVLPALNPTLGNLFLGALIPLLLCFGIKTVISSMKRHKGATRAANLCVWAAHVCFWILLDWSAGQIFLMKIWISHPPPGAKPIPPKPVPERTVEWKQGRIPTVSPPLQGIQLRSWPDATRLHRTPLRRRLHPLYRALASCGYKHAVRRSRFKEGLWARRRLQITLTKPPEDWNMFGFWGINSIFAAFYSNMQSGAQRNRSAPQAQCAY